MTTVAVDDVENPAAGEPAPRRRSLLGRAVAGMLWLGIGGAIVLLAMAWLYPSNLRETSRPLMLLNCFAFAGHVLAFHLGLAAVVALLVALVLWRWKLATAALLVVVVGLGPTLATWRPKSPPPVAGDTLRIHSVNILAINYSPNRIWPELNRVDGDVLVFQEWHDWHERFLRPELTKTHPYVTTFPNPSTNGMAIFSRIPFLEATPDGQEVRLGENGRRAQRVVIEHEGRPLVIYNIHPSSPQRPGALVWSQRQMADLVDHLRSETLPLVVAGDFNATPGTANLTALEEMGLAEAHTLAGRGPGWTWPRMRTDSLLHKIARRLPGIRIDHCYLSPDLTAAHAEVGSFHGSDHLGVIADIGWRDELP